MKISLEKLSSSFTIVEECWEWNKGKGKNGYGRLRIGSKTLNAHRVAYLAWVGEIPDGMLVCHSCDNPPCINPEHLFLGSPRDNMLDKTVKGRGTFGSAVNTAVLTEDDLPEIAKARANGETYRSIARRYGVHWKTISRAANGKTWKHAKV